MNEVLEKDTFKLANAKDITQEEKNVVEQINKFLTLNKNAEIHAEKEIKKIFGDKDEILVENFLGNQEIEKFEEALNEKIEVNKEFEKKLLEMAEKNENSLDKKQGILERIFKVEERRIEKIIKRIVGNLRDKRK